MNVFSTIWKYRTLKKAIFFACIGLVLLSACSRPSVDAVALARLTSQGTPEELRHALQAAEIDNVSTIKFGRNHSLIHVAITNRPLAKMIMC